MSVLIETTIGDIAVDLDCENYKIESYNFLKLCEARFYDYQCLYQLEKNKTVRFGDALVGFEDREELRTHNTSIKGINFHDNIISLEPQLIRPSNVTGVLQSVRKGQLGLKTTLKDESKLPLIGSQAILLIDDVEGHIPNCVFFAEVLPESLHLLNKLNDIDVDNEKRPLADIRIKKIHIVSDPFPRLHVDQVHISLPLKSIRLPKKWLSEHEYSNEKEDKIMEDIKRKELTLEIACDSPMMGIKPSDNVLFICKLNELTKAKDIATIFHRFGEIVSIELLRDKNTGRSLCYGFIEFKEKSACELAFKEMDGVLIDDKRVHVDFSQSVKKAYNNT